MRVARKRNLVGCGGQLGDLEVEVLYLPGKGTSALNGWDVHREVESEESRKQSAGLTNRKRIGRVAG